MKLIALSLITVSALATTAIAANPNFETHKSKVISRIDARIAKFQEEKSCVQAAQKQSDIKACKEKLKADINAMKKQN